MTYGLDRDDSVILAPSKQEHASSLQPGEDATPPAEDASRLRRGLRWTLTDFNWLFGLAGLFGCYCRLMLHRSARADLSSDEAVIYLMARHAAHGEFRVFYWGQYYGGTALPDLLGLVFRVTGSHQFLLPTVEMLLAAVGVVLLRVIGRQIWDLRIGNIAAALFWIVPIWVYFSGHDPIYANSGLLASMAAVAAALKFRSDGRLRFLVLAGIAAGVGWWSTPFALLICWPLGLFVFRRDGWRTAGAVGLGFVVGAAPWLRVLITDPHGLLKPNDPQEPFFTAARHVITHQLVYGFEAPAYVPVSERTGALIGVAAYLLVIAAAVYFAARRQLVPLLLTAVPLLLPFYNSALHLITLPVGSRYTLFAFPTFALLLAWLAVRIRLAPLAVAATAVGSVLALNQIQAFTPVDAPRSDPQEVAVAKFLEAQGRTHVFASYWVAYKIDMLSNERVTAADTWPNRYPPYWNAAAAAPKTTVVAQVDQHNDVVLRNSGATRIVVGPYVVYEFDRQVNLSTLPPLLIF